MKKVFCPPQGAITGVLVLFLAPSGCPFIYIYQAGAQRTLGAVAPPLLPLTLCALPALHRETGAITGNALSWLKRQTGLEGHTIGARLHGPQLNIGQLRHAMHPGRALHDVCEIHHLVSNVHHHRCRWTSKPVAGARCHRATTALNAGGLGSMRRAAVADHRRIR